MDGFHVCFIDSVKLGLIIIRHNGSTLTCNAKSSSLDVNFFYICCEITILILST